MSFGFNFYYLLLVINLNIFIIKGIVLPYSKNGKKYQVKLYFAGQKNGVYFEISQNTSYNVINQEWNTFPNEPMRQVIIVSNNEETTENSATIYLSENLEKSIHNFHYLPSKFLNNSITFNYRFKDYPFSLIHLLNEEKYIDRLRYTFDPLSYIHGNIFFGTHPEKHFPENMSCSVQRSSKNWECKMVKVYFSDNTNANYNFEKFASFQINKRKSIVPCEFLDFVKENPLRKYFERKECSFEERNNKRFIVCSQRSLLEKEEVKRQIINLERISFSVKLTSQFICQSDKCYYNYKCFTNKKAKWVFGNSFLESFIVTYDYEESKIFFTSAFFDDTDIRSIEKNNDNSEKIIKKDSNIKMICKLVLILNIILCVGIIINLKKSPIKFLKK